MVVDKCRVQAMNMTLEQRLSRWKRKKASPHKNIIVKKRQKWRDLGVQYADIVEMKKTEIRTKTGEMIDEGLQYAREGQTAQAILLPSLADIQKDLLQKSPQARAEDMDMFKVKKKLKVHESKRRNTGLGHLDFMLNSTYVHGEDELFPEKVDVYFQPETLTCRHTLTAEEQKKLDREALRKSDEEDPLSKEAGVLRLLPDGTCRYILRSVPERDHPIRYGGLRDLKSPDGVKLAISSSHMPQTKDGFSRKVDGTFYCV